LVFVLRGARQVEGILAREEEDGRKKEKKGRRLLGLEKGTVPAECNLKNRIALRPALRTEGEPSGRK